MDLRDVFAANLRRLRNARGLAQDGLAYEANVSRSYLSQLEKGASTATNRGTATRPNEPLRHITDPRKRSQPR